MILSLNNFLFYSIFEAEEFLEEKADDEMDIVKDENNTPAFAKDNLTEDKIEIDNFIASKTRLSRAINEEMINQL